MNQNVINVYSVTPDGDRLTCAAEEYIQNVICGAYSSLGGAEFLFHSGTDLNDPTALADVLEENAGNSFVTVSSPDKSDVAFCRHGSGEDGIAFVIRLLRDAAAEKPARASWDALWSSIENGRRGEDGET